MKTRKCSICNIEIRKSAKYDPYMCRECENEEIMKEWYVDKKFELV